MHDLSAATVVEEYDYTILWPCAPVSFHNPLPQVEGGVQGEEQKETGVIFSGHIKGELLDLRACFNCRKQQRFSLGALRKDPSRKPGARYKNYRRSKFGCRTCGVPLCRNSGCWLEYHRSDYCGQNDNIDPINWLTV